MLQTPRGTYDILPEDQPYWETVKESFKQTALSFGFQQITTPLLEYRSVFEKGAGEITEIVNKQMYRVYRSDLSPEEGEEEIVLRPEGTAPVARAYIQYGMQTWLQPVKLFYLGPMFRYEKPQHGRFRQHYQFGLEILGVSDPLVDALLIGVVNELYQNLGLQQLTFKINSIGCPTCRPKMVNEVVRYFRASRELLCPFCQTKLAKNPLRIYDCKEEGCQQLINNAPVLIDLLCPACKDDFTQTLEYLDDLNIPYDLDFRLVRGLDYYTKTVFEVIAQEGEPSLGGGGRYDQLIELFGGPPTGATGFATGLERVIEEMKAKHIEVKPPNPPQIFLIYLGESAKKKSLSLLFALRHEGLQVGFALGKESLRSQLKTADKLKVPFVLILGQKESKEGTVIIRDMNSGAQETVEIKKLPGILRKKFTK